MEVARKFDEPDITIWDRIFLKDISSSLETMKFIIVAYQWQVSSFNNQKSC